MSHSSRTSSFSSDGENKEGGDNSSRRQHHKKNRIELLVNQSGSPNNLKNLYENIGTRVSKLREINDGYEKKIKEQEEEIKLLDERIKAKKKILEQDMRGQGSKKENIKLHDPKWVNELYQELLDKGEITMQISQNHVQNDPALKKAYQQKESELSQLKNQLNTLIKKTDHIKKEINVLRIENNKHKANLDLILEKKERQNKEMNKISEEANKYLLKKGTINEELIKLNKKIDAEKNEHESKMQELNKMIDNTKKIKEFHETLAFEKFSNSSIKKNNYGNNKKPTSKMAEEKDKLLELEKELARTKRRTVHLNFSKLILLKKQIELNEIIDKVKKETGIDNLDKLSSDLQLSTKTNSLFEKDLETLHLQKKDLEKNIEQKKIEIQNAYCILNDTSTKKNEYMEKLEKDLKNEEENKAKLNRRLFALNRMIDLMSKGFKNICEKLNFFDKNMKFDAETSEETLTKCMDFLERKMIEIIQLNTDPLKETNISENDETKNMMFIKKISDGMNHEEHDKMFDKRKAHPSNFNLKDIKEISKDMVQAYMKKFDKLG
jgi:chromosome segregation ATPase